MCNICPISHPSYWFYQTNVFWIAKEYRNKVEELLQILPNTEDQHVEAAWEDIKQVICKAAGNILGQKPRTVRNGWYDEEWKEMLEEQNNEHLKMLQRKTQSNI